MKKLVLISAVLMLAYVAGFAGGGEGEGNVAPKTIKECRQQCKDTAKGCIGAAEDNKAQIRECRKQGISCATECRKECLNQCTTAFNGCMNAAEADRKQINACKRQNNMCKRGCR